ncbi:hypothetical protein [Nostoc sp. FACHB-133]|uniref:hypothetical protein n=1 Tax=Nostoc sp. FACHB-133 TaxID=2692835 RepID=UPI001688D164|nr:hypothetical protein [Nostoc sp. FACHB-133]MBD2526464.1 hypothetical protein [Nostoc sp. FACHB-133]
MKAATKDAIASVEKSGLGQMSYSPGKNSSQLQISPSKNPSKNRRRKGEGNGCIYCRTIIKNGKEYIPPGLLSRLGKTGKKDKVHP